MNILFTGTFPPHPGGSGVVNGQLLEGLLAGGCHLRIVTPASPETSGRFHLMRDRFRGAALFEIALDRAQTEPWSDGFDNEAAQRQIAATLQLCEERFRDLSPDLLLVGREASLWGLPELAARYGVPIAVICHAASFLLGGGVPDAMADRVLRELRKVDLAIAPANHTAEALIATGLKNVRAIPNSVDTALFRPGPKGVALRRTLGIPDDHVVVCHASNLKSVKRVGDIVASAAVCVRTNRHLTYLIIGDGPCLRDLQDAARRYGIEDHLRTVGWVDRHDMPNLLRIADIAVMPSAVEGLAMAYLEAMATGLVLVASDIAGANEVIRDGDTGFTFPVGDVAAVSDLTLRIATDAALRKRVGRRARTHILAHHRIEESARHLADALFELTGAGARKIAG